MNGVLAIQLGCKCDFGDAWEILWKDRASCLLLCVALTCNPDWLRHYSTKLNSLSLYALSC